MILAQRRLRHEIFALSVTSSGAPIVLDDLAIVSLMTPRADMVMLDVSASQQDVLRLVEISPHSRYPVVRGETDEVVGVVSARELLLWALRGEALDLETTVQPALFVPERSFAYSSQIRQPESV